jgi:gamma-glutamyltranspeptidase
LAWEQLFEQSAQLCEQGFVVDKSLAAAIKETFTKSRIFSFALLFFCRLNLLCSSSTRLGALLFGKKEGDVVLRPDLAQTLRLLARSPSDFYNVRKGEKVFPFDANKKKGTLASTLASEVRAQGGVLQDADMANYTARSLPVVGWFSFSFCCVDSFAGEHIL